MIDVEYEVFTRLSSALKAEYPGIDVASEYQRKPLAMPHVSFEMMDSYPYWDYFDNLAKDSGDVIVFEINIYSNKAVGKKQECKKIAGTIDQVMRRMNFRRTVLSPVPNLEDSTIYRMTGRWIGLVDGNYFYRG